MSSGPVVEVHGMRELRKTMKAAGEDLKDIKAVHQAAGNIVVALAKTLAPHRSGALAGSIRAARLASGVAVRAGGARIPYANPIHWGWPKRHIEASLFLSRAAQQSEPQWTELYFAEMERIIDRVKGD